MFHLFGSRKNNSSKKEERSEVQSVKKENTSVVEKDDTRISAEDYEYLKKHYGQVASWALWARPGSTPKSNTADLRVFQNPDLLNILNPDYVFVGLNASSTHGEWSEEQENTWRAFHSSYARQNDYKLRFALMDTPYWGAYITDIIKEYQEVDSSKVTAYLKHHPEVVRQNVALFKDELSHLSSRPVLIALGDKTYSVLEDYLGREYTILKIKHYSYTIGKEDYRKEVLEILSSVNR